MIRFFKDIKSTLYEPDGYMSLPRFVFFLNFVLFVAAILSPFITIEKCQITATTLGITGAGFIGNKYVSRRRKPHNEDVEVGCTD